MVFTRMETILHVIKPEPQVGGAPPATVTTMDFSDNCAFLAVGTASGDVRLVDLTAGKVVKSRVVQGGVTHVRFLPMNKGMPRIISVGR